MVDVFGSISKDRFGATIYSYNSSYIGSNYASGSFEMVGSHGQIYYTPEQARAKAEADTAQYFGIPSISEDQTRWDQEIRDQAVANELHAKRDALLRGYGGRFSDTALQDVTTDPGNYLPSYIQKLPQNKAEELIKTGKIGGWQVNDRYFRTQQEANAFINQGVIANKVLTQQEQYPTWAHELNPQLQISKDLKKKFESKYEPYTTIEGTTVYKPKDIIVPGFGKMVPQRDDPATKFISENFEKGDRFVSDRLMLDEILNPVIKSIEERKSIFTPVVRDASGRGAGLIDVEEFTKGAIKGVRDKPLTIAGNIALTLLVTKGTGVLVSKVPTLAEGIGEGAIASKINAVNLLGVGLAGMYAGDVGVRYSKAPNKSAFAGELLTTELIPFGTGGYLGTKDLRIKSSINDAIRILKSQKEPLKALYFDESGTLVKTKWQKEAGKPEKKEVAQPRQETKQGTDVFNYFKGRTPAQPFSGVGKGGLGEFKSPADRLLEQISPIGSGRESYLDYQKRVVSGIFEKRSGESSIAYKKMIPKAKDILKATTTKKGNIESLNKLWEDRGIIAASKEVGAKTKEGQIVLTKQKIVQLTKQEVKTSQIIKEKVRTIQTTKEDIKVIEKPKNGVYALAYVSAASRLMNRLKENTLAANVVISKEQARTKPQMFTSETAKAIERIKEITKATVSERVRLAEKEQVREKVKEKTQEKQRTRTIESTKMRVPERLVKLRLPKFASEIDRISKKRKNRGKYVWDINNPVPTLKSVIG